MAAVLTLRVYTTVGETESSAVTGIDLISADNATNTLGNRQANPVTAGENSFTKYCALRVDTAPDNYVENFLVWGDGTFGANMTLAYKIVATASYATPTASTLAGTTDFTTATSGAKATWHSGQLTTIGNKTDYLVFQLQTTGSAAPGSITQETVNYSYDEA